MTTYSHTARPRHAFGSFWRNLLTGALLATAGAGLLAWCTAAAAEQARVLPAPAMDLPSTSGSTSPQVAVLAGGCFWGVQGVFQHVKGVTDAVSGYSGGKAETAQYNAVSSGRTGHAESVQVTFDPQQISYGKILQIYFSVAHDPTQLDRQGPDTGTQYRSVIFPANTEQAKIATAYINQLEAAKIFKTPIVTKIDTLQAFYPAEAYHQDFLVQNPHNPYIVINDLPKIENLKHVFPELYRPEPVLVTKR